ncbi:MAG TPA: aminotransferase class I/II-fold pyridoxal phosphate-dependent enzyme [Feifaniaceae bacterium]|nr:aminotransferase class I/II-fold pyridoxal phosphate-dependent enzyme [Feifaniaceae bacterium]
MLWDTLLIHGGIDGDAATGAVSVPVYQTSTYRQKALGELTGKYEYSRTANPTRDALEALIAELEGGAAGFAFASGMAATTAVLFLFQSGDKLLLSSNVYGGTFRVLDRIFRPFGLSYEIVDLRDLAAVEAAFTPEVKGVIAESPTNPLLEVTDLAAIAKIAKAHNALTIVDNTFLTPYLQRPIPLGADIVLHSATKYLGGHSDLIAGLAVVNTPELAERLHFIQNATGGVLPPHDSWLLVRSIKTLGIRMDRHVENARYVVEYLRRHPAVERVYYPDNEINAKQADGPGAMVSFVLKSGYDAPAFFRSVKLITLGESLGGVESLLTHPASMTHAAIPKEIREKVGIVDNLARLSVGLESKEDIVADLERAIAAARM